jgi:sugar lactone lactonase YvrE
MDRMPMSIAPIPLSAITPFGRGLHRPECVLPAPNGDVYVPDWRGGVAVVRADGSTQSWLARNPGFDLKPNGIGFLPDGRFLIANLGDQGGIWAMDTEGKLTPFLTEVGGRSLPPANFVWLDEEQRVWITVSTRHVPRQTAWRSNVKDGLLIMVDDSGPHIMADDFHYTNEARTSGSLVYVVETFGRRLIRFPLLNGHRMGPAELVVQLDKSDLPDGFAFDREGGIWITSLVSNRILHLDADGALAPVIAETNESFAAEVEEAYAAGRMERAHLGPIPGTRFQQLTSIGFGGPDNRTGYLGSLHADCLYRFTSPVAGLPQPWWGFPLP